MGKLALRKPDVPASVVPIFRYDHTQVPNFFFDQILPHLSRPTEIGIVLIIFKFMSDRQDEEIITTCQEIANLLDVWPAGVRKLIGNLEKKGILTVNRLERNKKTEAQLYQIKVPNHVNYKNL